MEVVLGLFRVIWAVGGRIVVILGMSVIVPFAKRQSTVVRTYPTIYNIDRTDEVGLSHPTKQYRRFITDSGTCSLLDLLQLWVY